MSVEFHFCRMKKFWRLCITRCDVLYSAHVLNCTRKMVNVVSFMLGVLYVNEKHLNEEMERIQK